MGGPSSQPLNKAEELVLRVCHRTFLSLWCYNNPRAEAGKELCDILVVCEPHVIIVSIKDIHLGEGGLEVEHNRWERKAIDSSVKQIYGAERWLISASQVIRKDGSPGLNLPPVAQRKVHRVAVAFGGREEVIIKSGDFGKGFVHVMSEHSLLEVLAELDTVTDLVEYLAAKEVCLAGGCSVVIEGSESNLLGWYLYNKRSFPSSQNLLLIDDTVWRGLRGETGFRRRKEADQESYVWDRLIELLSDQNAKSISGPGPTITELELALRVMAREPRLSRRVLGGALRQFVEQAKAKKLRSRVLISPGGNIYVFVNFPASEAPKSRVSELGCRCVIARHKVGRGDNIVGVGLSDYVPGIGSVSDLIYMYRPDWSAVDDEAAAKMEKELGYFAGAPTQHSHVDEFPTA